MTKQEAGVILEKENICYHTPIEKCCTCIGCEGFTAERELHEAMKMAIDILKEGEKDGE